MYFVAGGTKKVKQPPKKREHRPALEHVPGVRVGMAIEWAHGNNPRELTSADVYALQKYAGWKDVSGVKAFKALQVKSLMQSKTCAQIVRHFAGKNGMKERTVKRIHAALSHSGGGAK